MHLFKPSLLYEAASQIDLFLYAVHTEMVIQPDPVVVQLSAKF